MRTTLKVTLLTKIGTLALLTMLTAAAHAQSNGRYMSVSVIYRASGVMAQAGEGAEFATAQQCERYVKDQIGQAIANGEAAAARTRTSEMIITLGESVVSTSVHSAYFWFGCIHPEAYGSVAFLKYVDVRLTPERAEMMQLFPELAKDPPTP